MWITFVQFVAVVVIFWVRLVLETLSSFYTEQKHQSPLNHKTICWYIDIPDLGKNKVVIPLRVE